MKRIILIITTLMLCSGIYSQDTIVRITGEQIKARVLWAGMDKVKYVNYDDVDEVIHKLPTIEVYLIKFQNGDKKYYNKERVNVISAHNNVPLEYRNGFWGITIRRGERKLRTLDVKRIFSNDLTALSKFNRGRAMEIVSTVLILPSSYFFGFNVGMAASGKKINTLSFGIASVGLATSFILGVNGNKLIRQSVDLYNDSLKKTNTMYISFGPTANGVGVCMRF